MTSAFFTEFYDFYEHDFKFNTFYDWQTSCYIHFYSIQPRSEFKQGIFRSVNNPITRRQNIKFFNAANCDFKLKIAHKVKRFSGFLHITIQNRESFCLNNLMRNLKLLYLEENMQSDPLYLVALWCSSKSLHISYISQFNGIPSKYNKQVNIKSFTFSSENETFDWI